MALTVNITEEQNAELERLSKAFNISKAAVLRNLAFNNIKNVKTADYNLVYAELLQRNKNVSELLNYVKKEGTAEELVSVLRDIKKFVEEVQKKI